MAFLFGNSKIIFRNVFILAILFIIVYVKIPEILPSSIILGEATEESVIKSIQKLSTIKRQSEYGNLKINDKVALKYFENILNLIYVEKPLVDTTTFSNFSKDENAYINQYTVDMSHKDYFTVSEEDLIELRDKHESFKNNIPETYPEGLFKGKGIAMLATQKKFISGILIIIKILREYGSINPVEVFFKSRKNDYDKEVCESILPSLNAACMFLDDIYSPNVLSNFFLPELSYKSLAILGSTFEEVIFLDSNSIPTINIDKYLNKEPYLSYGLVLWPDYWKRMTHSDFFKIALINGRPFPDLASESGQLVINKKSHIRSLILAVYYNLYGHDLYHDLLFQHGVGLAEKETYIPAAVAFNLPFYQVERTSEWIGYVDSDKMIHPIGTGLYDPEMDWKQGTSVYLYEMIYSCIHLNIYKFDLFQIMKDKKFHNNKDDRYFRMLGSPRNVVKKAGVDIELILWRQIKWFLCENGLLGINIWNTESSTLTYYCNVASEYTDYLENSSHDESI